MRSPTESGLVYERMIESSSHPTRVNNAWLIADTFGKASEVWLYRQASLIKRLHLSVLTNSHQNADRYPADGFEVNLIRGVTPLPRNVLLLHAQRKVRSWQNREFGGFRGSPSEAAWWKEQVARDRPNVALIHFGRTAVEMHPILERLGVPVVAHFHGVDISAALRRPLYRRRLVRASRRFASSVVVADYQREWLLEQGVPEGRVAKIPCGVPLGEFSESTHVGDSPCNFLAVGRLVPKKRPDLTVRAFAACLDRGADATLVVIGAGDLYGECKALAESLGVAHKMSFLGEQPITEVKRHLRRAGTFVQHSVTGPNGDMEGWPVSIAEAAASGLPVVSTRHASIPEQVEHGVSGLLCAEGDWRTMSDHMYQLATNPQRRIEMGRAARERIAAFDTAQQVRKLEDVLLRVANRDP